MSFGRCKYLFINLSSFFSASITRAAFRSAAACCFREAPFLTGATTKGTLSINFDRSSSGHLASVAGGLDSRAGELIWGRPVSERWPRLLFFLACRLGRCFSREIASLLDSNLSCTSDNSRGGATRLGGEHLFVNRGLGFPDGDFQDFESPLENCPRFESQIEDCPSFESQVEDFQDFEPLVEDCPSFELQVEDFQDFELPVEDCPRYESQVEGCSS